MTDQVIVYEDVVFTRRIGYPLRVDTAPQHTKMDLAVLLDARAYIHAHDPGHLVFADQVEYAVTGYDPADCTLTLQLVKDHRLTEHAVKAAPDPLPPYLAVQEYRTDDGRQSWVFRCWGDGDCDGALHLDLGNQPYAERKAREHIAEAHPAGTS